MSANFGAPKLLKNYFIDKMLYLQRWFYGCIYLCRRQQILWNNASWSTFNLERRCLALRHRLVDGLQTMLVQNIEIAAPLSQTRICWEERELEMIEEGQNWICNIIFWNKVSCKHKNKMKREKSGQGLLLQTFKGFLRCICSGSVSRMIWVDAKWNKNS